MTPEQKIKLLIINLSAEWNEQSQPEVTALNVDDLYEVLVENDEHWDAWGQVREGDTETDLPCESSRYYESKSVASKLPDNTWVGWTYWYGGGKHGEPDAIDWIEDAYHLDVKEEEKLVTVRTFTKLQEK